jgi:hypothetical protein
MNAIMDKKKSPAEEKKRVPIALRADWHAVAKQLAAKEKLSLVWFLIDLINDRAIANGLTDLPHLPWELPEEE